MILVFSFDGIILYLLTLIPFSYWLKYSIIPPPSPNCLPLSSYTSITFMYTSNWKATNVESRCYHIWFYSFWLTLPHLLFLLPSLLFWWTYLVIISSLSVISHIKNLFMTNTWQDTAAPFVAQCCQVCSHKIRIVAI